MAVEYQNRLTSAVAGAMKTTDALPAAMQALKKHAKEDGFTTAGAWYMTTAQVSYTMNSLTQNISPSIHSTALPPNSDDSVWKLAHRMMNEKDKAKQNSATPTGKSGDSGAAWKLMMAEMGDSVTWLGQGAVARFITESSGKPVMIRIKDMADNAVGSAAALITIAGTVMGPIEHPLASAFTGALKPWIAMIVFVSQMVFGFFLMCSIYLPMIPFIVFMGCVLNWLITVVEGVAAAPFLAFAHLDTDGEGLGHKTQYGYVFMLQSFMRPVMLVLGFVFACIILETIGGYVMAIYPTVMANTQIDSITGLFSIFGFIALFMVIMVGLINTSMSVMYLLPDAIFSFIGAQSSATSAAGRHESDNTKGAFASAGGGMRQVQVGFKSKPQSTQNNKQPSAGGDGDGGFKTPGA